VRLHAIASQRVRDTGPAVSRSNVDRIRELHGAVGRAELSSLPLERLRSLMGELLDPDVEWRDQRELPGATVHRGVDAVMGHFAASRSALDYHTIELLDAHDGGSCVLATYRFHARGRASGVPVERDAVWVWSFREQKVHRVEIFATKAEALQAAGLT
jgi:ketosteroid isomerase-like protein